MTTPSDLLVEGIVADAFKTRSFLPGDEPTESELTVRLQKGSVLLDGLGKEAALLALSVLPGDTRRLFLAPMERGHSGARVFRGRYIDREGMASRPFVFKFGEWFKLEQERTRTALARGSIAGLGVPIFRKSMGNALLVQEFAGLDDKNILIDLAAACRRGAGVSALDNLFERRLATWYRRPARKWITIREVFSQYTDDDLLSFEGCPEQWSELHDWVQAEAGVTCQDCKEAVSRALEWEFDSPLTCVHGDLHALNVLIDDLGNVWPIDFAWFQPAQSPLVDLVMLECSLKFRAIPRRSELRGLLRAEALLLAEMVPAAIAAGRVPYSDQIENVFRAVRRVREVAQSLAIDFDAYRRALLVMTARSSRFEGSLNMAYLFGSLEILSAVLSAKGC